MHRKKDKDTLLFKGDLQGNLQKAMIISVRIPVWRGHTVLTLRDFFIQRLQNTFVICNHFKTCPEDFMCGKRRGVDYVIQKFLL